MADNTEHGRDNLDTVLMQEKLRGDSFPDNWDSYLNVDIKEFFDEKVEECGIKKGEIIRRANLSRTYGYQIMEGRRLGKRDYYLLIAIAMSLDLKTTQRMLAVAGCGPLHPLIKRDAAIIFAINHGYDNIKTYEFMSELDLEPLDDGSGND